MNSEKAGFVCCLTMEHVPKKIDDHWGVMDCLLNALVNMHSLSDFQVQIPTYEAEAKPLIESIEKILWFVYELGSLIF